jgi:G3E family GTPase
MREVHNKNNIILDWQIQDKKITEIENKLKDREYSKFIKYLADAETSLINKQFQIKKEMQHKYHDDLQQQEKHCKMLRKEQDKRMNPKEKGINFRESDGVEKKFDERSSERLGSRDHNQTIDVESFRHHSPLKYTPDIATLQLPKQEFGR